MSYTELLPQLIQRKLMVQTPIEPLKPLYSRWYNKNTYYDFHFGAGDTQLKTVRY
ncbi:hypothetical protein CRYUN_Cryun09bG0147800 [Craigia yunnanensis]